MAGVLFIILIPREGYEKCIKQNTAEQSNAELRRKSFQHQESLSGDESSTSKESKQSLDTCAVSIESDSLNRDEGNDKKRKSIHRTKSYEEILINPTQKDEKRRDNIGSMDSDDFDRTMKKIARTRENEEAVEKFFNCNNEKPPLDATASMERVLREIIDRMRIRNASWQRVNGGNSYKICFCLEKGIRFDDTIHMLSKFGIGEKEGSSIAVVPCTLYNDKTRLKEDDETSTSTAMFKETAWNRFVGSVRARMNVAKIVDAVRSDAAFSFDFVVLLITASVLASFGLVENSTLFLAASMLISPLMGPILAATFGSVIKDKKLQYWGMANEMLGIFLCIIVGFVFGMVICGIDYGFGEKKELTPEIISRTDIHSVIVGVFVALASGAAVAIAVLSENFGSLAGVAISASLLPPAVNTGLLWSYSLVHVISNYFQLAKFDQFVTTTRYSQNQSVELLILGTISLCLTLSNVLCVFIVGKVIVRLKIEVAPVLTEEERQFWKHDVPIARDYNKTINAEEGKKLEEEFIEYRGSENFKGVGAELLRQEFYPNTHTWSPLSHRFHTHRKDVAAKTSLRDLEALYKTIYGKIPNETQLHHEFMNNTTNPMHITAQPKHSDPIPTPKTSNGHHSKFNSAPHDGINDQILRRTTFVDIEGGNSTDDHQTNGVVYNNGKPRKFVVTSVGEPFI